MVCHKLEDVSKPVVGAGSADSYRPQDDKDSENQTTGIKPSPLKIAASAPGREFNTNSNHTGKGAKTNWLEILATNPKFVFKLMLMWHGLRNGHLGVRRIYTPIVYKWLCSFL